ncbi:MAG: flagellar hook-length control protein FliK [Methylobacter sp.]
MNIESANLSSLSPNSSTVESLPLLADGSVVSEGFSGALVAQIELLNNIKTENESPLQTPDVGGLSVDNVEMQDFAALLGNDLPPAYKIKDEVDHEAALAAVTDSLKYISKDTAAGETAIETEQRMNGVIAMAVPVEQGMSDTVAVPVEQGMNDAVAATASVEQNMKNEVALAAPVEQNTTAAAVETAQPMNDAVVTEAQVQAGVEHGNDRPDKQQAESEVQVAVVEENRGAEELLASIIIPVVVPTGREKAVTVNNLAPADVTKESVASFIKPSTEDAKPNQFTKVAGDVLQSEAVFRQPVQNKQDFNLKYLEDAGQAEKTGRVEQPASSLEGEKSLSRVDLAQVQVNKPIVDNKTDVPAITKPLSHPEWNKDLGERIVWMSSKAIPSAEIRLNPQHLGPISVRVNVTDDQATVVFTAQHAATREAIEASVPKLREMMGAQQLNLAEVNVSQSPTPDQGRSQSQSFAQNFADSRGQGSSGTVVEGADVVEQDIESGQAVVSKGLLSLYA